jgi:hypothetical protein
MAGKKLKRLKPKIARHGRLEEGTHDEKTFDREEPRNVKRSAKRTIAKKVARAKKRVKSR